MFSSEFFQWAEPLLLDDPDLHAYFLAGCLPPDRELEFRLWVYEMLYELELEAGLLDGREMEWD